MFDAIRRDVASEHELPVEAIALIKAGSIPKTSSGKIQRHACRQGFLDNTLEIVADWRAWSGQAYQSPRRRVTDVGASEDDERPTDLAPAAGSTGSTSKAASDATMASVMEHVRGIAKERARDLKPETSIVELGLDSLERMEIIAALEDTFGGRFPESELLQMETVAEVAAGVEAFLGKAPRTRDDAAAAREIEPERYNFELMPEYLKLRKINEGLTSTGLRNPYFKCHDGVIADTTRIDGRELVSYASYNYVGMSGDPRVSAAAKKAIDRFGTSVSASRLVSGEKTIHREFEQSIADFLGTEAAVVFVGGHATNESTLGHLFGPGDMILHDSLAHNSIVQGAIMSGARRRPFPHNDWQACDKLLTELRHEYRRVLIAIEGVYSMDGDIAPVPRFVELRKKHKVFLYVDEAHSLGVLGAHGRGMSEYFNIPAEDVDIWMGTLSKSLGSCGGYIAGKAALIEYIKYTAPGFIFSAGMPPSNVAAAMASLQVLQAEPERLVALQQRSAQFVKLARERGLNIGMSEGTPIVPIILGNSLDCLRLSQALFDRGINVQPILHPAVEEKASRLRFFITSKHTEKQIRDTVNAVAEELKRIGPQYFKPRGELNGHHAAPIAATPTAGGVHT